jgi:hypothetical protein
MASGNVAQGISARHHRQAERQSHAHEANAHLGKFRRQHSRSAAAKNKPGRTKKFRY